jgi:hypothetical protein
VRAGGKCSRLPRLSRLTCAGLWLRTTTTAHGKRGTRNMSKYGEQSQRRTAARWRATLESFGRYCRLMKGPVFWDGVDLPLRTRAETRRINDNAQAILQHTSNACTTTRGTSCETSGSLLAAGTVTCIATASCATIHNQTASPWPPWATLGRVPRRTC